MNTNQMLDFIKPYFEKPVFEEWQPDKYYMKYIFKGTKASIRKLNAKKAKDAAKHFPSSYDAIVGTTNSLSDILDKMEVLLGGMPEWCEREASWGLKGYYNGIIGRGTKRVSMKSFFAGGYNIQRLHIRCRCTPLKEAAA